MKEEPNRIEVETKGRVGRKLTVVTYNEAPSARGISRMSGADELVFLDDGSVYTYRQLDSLLRSRK